MISTHVDVVTHVYTHTHTHTLGSSLRRHIRKRRRDNELQNPRHQWSNHSILGKLGTASSYNVPKRYHTYSTAVYSKGREFFRNNVLMFWSNPHRLSITLQQKDIASELRQVTSLASTPTSALSGVLRNIAAGPACQTEELS